MNVIVDTSIWSLAFRRRRKDLAPPDRKSVYALTELIRDNRVDIIGAIRQEVLSGLPERKEYEWLRDYLRAFPDLFLDETDFEHAAEIFNVCLAKGVHGTHNDFLICAAAERHGSAVFSVDADFQRISKACGTRLFHV
jgi:predicted nucleic acid-binding protein